MKKVISILAITGASLLTASIPSYAGDLVEFSVIPDGTISVKKYDPLTFMVVIQGFVSGHITGYSYFVNWDGTELVTSTGQQPSMLHQKTGLYIDPAISTEIGTFTFTVNNPTPFAAVDFSLPDFFIDTRNQAYLPKYQINDNKNPDGTIQWQNGKIGRAHV